MASIEKQEAYSVSCAHIKSMEGQELIAPSQKQTWRQKQTTGWRLGAVACAFAAAAVFLVNLLVFIWAESRNGTSGFKEEGGKGVLYDGNCGTAKKLNIGIHLLINVLGTILLSGSNYCMQIASAPTRREVDKAHEKMKWLDIGVLSVRNLRSIAGKRQMLYWVLAISSLPLHIFYNSTVFSSIAGTEYYVYSVNQAFVNSRAEDFDGFRFPVDYGSDFKYHSVLSSRQGTARQLFDQARNGSLQKLEASQCIDAYAQQFLVNRGSLLLVVPDSSERYEDESDERRDEIEGVPNLQKTFGTEPALKFEDYVPVAGETSGVDDPWPFDWMCRLDGQNQRIPCEYRLASKRDNTSDWRPYRKEILYCLSEPVEEHCRLLYSAHLFVIIIFLNAFKAMVMLYLAFWISESPLLTIGDAMASFLTHPDPLTEGMCMASKKEIKAKRARGTAWSVSVNAREYDNRRKRQFSAASVSRWIFCIILLTLAIGVCMGLLIYGVSQVSGPSDINTLLGFGIGAINTATFIRWDIPSSGTAGVIGNVFVANSPQVILSFLYLTYNGLFTDISLASEWSQKALYRKGLRVSSNPKGAQRSTYFLQLPYRFSIPLMVVSGTLHWLVSQSIFLVSVDAYRLRGISSVYREHNSFEDYVSCGYSPVAIVAVIVVGVLMIVAAISFGFLRLGSGMPIVSSCSAAISAACHPHSGGEADEAMEFLKLQWGAIPTVGGVGHCTITSHEVTEPHPGQEYAGLKSRNIF